MNNRKSQVVDLGLMEKTLFQTVTALTEAMVRQAAVEHRGPLISPNPEAWESYVQELREELASRRQQLDEYLASIEWKDSPLPGDPALWPAWWNAVRSYANHTRYTVAGILKEPLAE